MATLASSVKADVDKALSERSPTAPWAKFFLATAALLTLFTCYRFYQHATAFTYGLDFFSPEFQKYWMSLLYSELSIEVLFGVGAGLYLWATRDRNLDKIKPGEELRRYMVMMSLLLAFGVIFYIVASIYTESDAAWHQITIRDTDFTPTHIGLFYFGVPCFILASFVAFMYARTRIPQFANKLSLPFALLVAGPFMIMPNLGLNEWGHTFFYAEELFAAPIHWGFVALGWSAFAAGGLIVQVLTRVVQLTRLMSVDKAASAA
ncbi:methane/ammonia monooxygenase subunit C [Solimonas aquatica]|uniref:Methane/ammonia monooxygenase subunit C n=1 Tax=Solimonas aquatica TaxID=489703 RepID=A0A1H9DRQ2_9GAMM|nr:methane monooxygenase/ammonia monooxygenase subunit C [Solimonas aquatica]SEQ16180.1 methane/ammonia monooxygenase subunit C [Solimonas aquatica]